MSIPSLKSKRWIIAHLLFVSINNEFDSIRPDNATLTTMTIATKGSFVASHRPKTFPKRNEHDGLRRFTLPPKQQGDGESLPKCRSQSLISTSSSSLSSMESDFNIASLKDLPGMPPSIKEEDEGEEGGAKSKTKPQEQQRGSH